tara:strand:+ start:649 stop:1836 length:1188 start_codon:yes stop_codon:yes gene_type:complete
MALNTVSSDRLSTNVKNTNFTAAEKQDLTDDIKPLLGSSGGGNKNLIVNGSCIVAQRGVTYTGANPFTTVDRFRLNHTGLNEDCTTAQADVASGTTPYTNGFRKSFKVTNGNQSAGAGAGDRIAIQYRLEAQDVANSGWNYVSSSSDITLQFWVKSSVAQNFFGRLYTSDGTSQNYPFQTGSLTADTWTKITKTIPGNSNLQFDNNSERGLDVEFTLFRGTNETGSVTLNQWAAFSSSTYTPDNTATWYTTNDATFEITGVQLEVGSVATEFEHRPFSLEERLCQRYYFRQSAEHQYMRYACHGQTPSANGAQYVYPLPVRMRAVPTLGYSALGDFYMYAGNLQSKTPTSLAMDAQSTISPMFVGAKSSTFTGGQMAHLTTPNANQGYLEFIAEL